MFWSNLKRYSQWKTLISEAVQSLQMNTLRGFRDRSTSSPQPNHHFPTGRGYRTLVSESTEKVSSSYLQ